MITALAIAVLVSLALSVLGFIQVRNTNRDVAAMIAEHEKRAEAVIAAQEVDIDGLHSQLKDVIAAYHQAVARLN